MAFWKNLIGGSIKDGAEGLAKLSEGVKTLITGKLPPDKEAEIMLRLDEIGNVSKKMQADINLADAQSGDKFQSRWRPFIGWVCGGGLVIQYIIYPLISIFTEVDENLYDFSELITLLIALLGLGTLRSYEKTRKG
jgi:hypothetical protein